MILYHLDCQGKETLGPPGLGRREEGCRRRPPQGKGDHDDNPRVNWFKRREVEQVLHQVRDEDEVEQFERLDKKQQEEMVKYKRPIIAHEEKAKTVP